MKGRGASGQKTVFWWVAWITMTIASFFVAHAIWTPIIAARFGSIREAGVSLIWVAAVFGTWMAFLVPLIIVMYSKVDKTYEDARIRREEAAERAERARVVRFKSVYVGEEDRLLPEPVAAKVRRIPETVRGGHLVTAVLKDGRRIPKVFVEDRKSLLGVYGVDRLDFAAADIADVEPVSPEEFADFRPENWLRLDGVGAGEGRN